MASRTALAQTLPYALHGLTIAAILASPMWSSFPKDLDVVELWSGVGAVAAAGAAAGLQVSVFEINNDPVDNFFTETGFLKAIQLISRLRPGGLLHMGPTCSSFVFPNSSNCKRSSGKWEGNTSYAPVAQGNLEAQMACFFFFLAYAWEIEACIENPAGSSIFSFLEQWTSKLPDLVTSCCPRCAFAVEPIGQRMKKPFKFLATARWISWMSTYKCPCGKAEHAQCMEKDDQGKVTGNQARLRESQAYPKKLGAALIESWCRGSIQYRRTGSRIYNREMSTVLESTVQEPESALLDGPWASESTIPAGTRQLLDSPWSPGVAGSAEATPKRRRLADAEPDSGPWAAATAMPSRAPSSSQAVGPWQQAAANTAQRRSCKDAAGIATKTPDSPWD